MSEWLERRTDPQVIGELEAAGYPRLLALLLAQRGVTAADADDYFHPDLRNVDWEGLPRVREAAAVVLGAVKNGRKIVVFGDYDCDGVCATAIVVRTLKALGADVSGFIPRRLDEGYGMSDASVARMLSTFPSVGLVITVDNGVNSVREVELLRRRGISVVVTDHHLPGEALPQADVLVNPKVAAPSHLQGLCGAGVALFLAYAVMTHSGEFGLCAKQKICEPLLVMAGLATITDIMPLGLQNRILVSEALCRFQNPDCVDSSSPMRRGAPCGLRELYLRAGRIGREAMTSRDFGFSLGPRINSVGRLEGEFGSAADALELMLCDEVESARNLAQRIDTANVGRKNFEQWMTDLANSLTQDGADAQVIELGSRSEKIHPGVAGIVAARVMDRLQRKVPVCVMVDGKGSARAPAGYNLRAALASCSSLLTNFGGHAAAAGLCVRNGCLDRFRVDFAAACRSQDEMRTDEERGIDLFVDAFVSLSDITRELAEAIRRMEPFGDGNPEPVFAVRNVVVDRVLPLGSDGRHLQLVFKGAKGLRGIWWRHGEDVESIQAAASHGFNVRFAVELSTFGESAGGAHPELRILDLVAAS